MKADIVFNVSLYVNNLKSGSGDTSCTEDQHINSCEHCGWCLRACYAESAESCYHPRIATGKGANLKLGMCVVGFKMQVSLEDGCSVNTQLVLGAQYHFIWAVLPYTSVAS